MPRNRILTETDGPFARGPDGPLQPMDVRIALDHLANIWSVDRKEVQLILRGNIRELESLALPAAGTDNPVA
jgi:TatD DNase family protein